MAKKRSIRVGMFGSYYPNYRLGVLNALSKMDNLELEVYTSLKPLRGFSLIDPSEAEFRVMKTSVWCFHIPFLWKSWNIIPFSVWSVLRGGHDVFVLPNRIGDPSVWLSLVVARITGRHICLWGHGVAKSDGYSITKLRKLMMCLAHANILYSESGHDKACEVGLTPGKLFIAYNALDTRRSQAIRESISSSDIKQFRQENDLIDRQIIIFSGRLQKRKKPELLVQAMLKVVIDFPRALAVFIGEGEMREELERLIQGRQLENSVRLLGAVYEEEIMARYLLCSTVAVMPASAGLFIQHAFDYGVPLVVGDGMKGHGPEIELVKNGETGIFCKNGDADEFAIAVERLLKNEEERQRMSGNCCKLIKEKYNVQNMADGIYAAIKSVVKTMSIAE